MDDERRQRILPETRLQGGMIYCPADNKLELSKAPSIRWRPNALELLSAGMITKIKSYADPQGRMKATDVANNVTM